MPAKKQKNTMGQYTQSSEDTKAYIWCIRNKIFISPLATGNGSWYIEINNGGKVNRSPESYGPTTIWIKLYEFYKYYYNKYAK